MADDESVRLQALQRAAHRASGHPLEGAKLLAPLPAPPHNVLCVGKNYHAHAREFTRSGFDARATAADAVPERPIIFTKPSSAIAGPHDAIPLWPGLDQAVDHEAELAVVIGRGGRFIRRDQAMAHVFGYTIVNDVTARDLQQAHKQWFLGKGIDGFCSTTLAPGDVIATGTPEGVGIGFDPPRFLRHGDVVEVEIEGIGAIRNKVRRVAGRGEAVAAE